MKPCSYCGRENQDEASSCRECGTEFVVLTLDAEPVERLPFGWLRFALRCFGLFVAIVCFYLLSLGPVTRYFCTTTRTPVVAGPTATGATMVQTVSRTYPGWVGIVYNPAFALQYGGGFGSLYSRYLEWWEIR